MLSEVGSTVKLIIKSFLLKAEYDFTVGNSLTLDDFTTELIHFQLLRSGNLLTLYSGH